MKSICFVCFGASGFLVNNLDSKLLTGRLGASKCAGWVDFANLLCVPLGCSGLGTRCRHCGMVGERSNTVILSFPAMDWCGVSWGSDHLSSMLNYDTVNLYRSVAII